jgi:hypothetical protein
VAERPAVREKGTITARRIGTGKGTAGTTRGMSLIDLEMQMAERKIGTGSEMSDLIEEKTNLPGDTLGVEAGRPLDVILVITDGDTKRTLRDLVVRVVMNQKRPEEHEGGVRADVEWKRKKIATMRGEGGGEKNGKGEKRARKEQIVKGGRGKRSSRKKDTRAVL